MGQNVLQPNYKGFFLINLIYMYMSNTNYNVLNNDLSTLFFPRIASDPSLPYNTNYIVNSEDLTQLFYPWTTGSYSTPTYYYYNGMDLNTIFQNIQVLPTPYTLTIGSLTNVTYSSNYNQIIFDINLSTDNSIISTGYSSILFNSACTLDVAVIGGGGYGGLCTASSQSDFDRGGGGGGGGDVQTISSISISPGTTYYITVGNGDKDYSGSSSGYASYFSTSQTYDKFANSQNTTTTVIAGGGNIGQSNISFTPSSGAGGSYHALGGVGALYADPATSGAQGISFTINNISYIYGSGGPGGYGQQNTTVATYPANNGNKTFGDGGPGANYQQANQVNRDYTIGAPGRVILYVH